MNKSTEYYHNNKDKFIEYQKKYKNKDDVKERISTYNKEYYKRNRDKLIAQICTPIVCECGFKTSINHLKRHQESNRHKKLLLNFNISNSINASPSTASSLEETS